jgi:hypothetical protein
MRAHAGFKEMSLLLLLMRIATLISEYDNSQKCNNGIEYKISCWHSMCYKSKTRAFLIAETNNPKRILDNL